MTVAPLPLSAMETTWEKFKHLLTPRSVLEERERIAADKEDEARVSARSAREAGTAFALESVFPVSM